MMFNILKISDRLLGFPAAIAHRFSALDKHLLDTTEDYEHA